MNFDRNCLRLYAVTDRAWVGRQTLCQQVEAALQGGATCVQLREKQGRFSGRGQADRRPLPPVRGALHRQRRSGHRPGLRGGRRPRRAGRSVRRRGPPPGGQPVHRRGLGPQRRGGPSGRGGGRRLPRGGGGLWLGHQDRRLPADPGRPARDLRGGAHPGGGHRRGERPQYPRAAGQRRGGGGRRLGHLRRAGHHRRLPGAARPGRYIIIGKRSRP